MYNGYTEPHKFNLVNSKCIIVIQPQIGIFTSLGAIKTHKTIKTIMVKIQSSYIEAIKKKASFLHEAQSRLLEQVELIPHLFHSQPQSLSRDSSYASAANNHYLLFFNSHQPFLDAVIH